MRSTIVQIGYRIDEARQEAVAINARLYRRLAEDLGWRVETVGYGGEAADTRRLRGFLRVLTERCSRGGGAIVHDFFVMPALSLVTMLHLRRRGVRARYVKTFINPPGGGGLASREGLLRLLLNNAAVCRMVGRLADRVTFLRPLTMARFHRLDAPLAFPPQPPRDHAGPVRIVYLGHALRKKGVDRLRHIIEHVTRARPGAAEFAFSFSELCDCPRAVRRLQAMSGCRVSGTADPAEFFRAGDVFLLPIRHGYAASGSFNTIPEAMAGGCCVVTARVAHLPEIVGPGNSVLVDPPRSERYAETLVSLIDDRRRLAELRRAAARDCAERYAGLDAEIREQLRTLYDSLAR